MLARVVFDAWRSGRAQPDQLARTAAVLHEEFAHLVEEAYHETNRWLVEHRVLPMSTCGPTSAARAPTRKPRCAAPHPPALALDGRPVATTPCVGFRRIGQPRAGAQCVPRPRRLPGCRRRVWCCRHHTARRAPGRAGPPPGARPWRHGRIRLVRTAWQRGRRNAHDDARRRRWRAAATMPRPCWAAEPPGRPPPAGFADTATAPGACRRALAGHRQRPAEPAGAPARLQAATTQRAHAARSPRRRCWRNCTSASRR
jgi:hypothetical protein